MDKKAAGAALSLGGTGCTGFYFSCSKVAEKRARFRAEMTEKKSFSSPGGIQRQNPQKTAWKNHEKDTLQCPPSSVILEIQKSEKVGKS